MLTKSFKELVELRATADPLLAVELQRHEIGAGSSENDLSARPETITVSQALRMIWEADSYPILGNGDAPVAFALSRTAFVKAARAVSEPDEPPEFARWLATLLDPSSPDKEREESLCALYDLFDP